MWIFVAIVVIIIIVAVAAGKSDSGTTTGQSGHHSHYQFIDEDDEGKRSAGKEGEEIVANVLCGVCREGEDMYWRNVNIECDGEQSEIDHLILTEYGLYAIESKNFSSKWPVYGEDKGEWYSDEDDGRKPQKNPVAQANRQARILRKILRDYGADIYVNAYAMLAYDNYMGNSQHVLKSRKDADQTIHKGYQGKPLESAQYEKVASVLTNNLGEREF